MNYSSKTILFGLIAAISFGTLHGQEDKKSSYAPVVPKEDFSATMSRMKAEKANVMKNQKDLLQERYDLRNSPAPGVTMSRGKAVQQGVRIKLRKDTTWEQL